MRYCIVLLLVLSVIPLPAATARPQFHSLLIAQNADDWRALGAAKNYARQAAERANGGLSVYRAEPAMHGPAANTPYVDNGEYWLFTIRGGAPGSTDFSVESDVRVDKQDFNTLVLYNGPLRR
jgi:hypothetical protein